MKKRVKAAEAVYNGKALTHARGSKVFSFFPTAYSHERRSRNVACMIRMTIDDQKNCWSFARFFYLLIFLYDWRMSCGGVVVLSLKVFMMRKGTIIKNFTIRFVLRDPFHVNIENTDTDTQTFGPIAFSFVSLWMSSDTHRYSPFCFQVIALPGLDLEKISASRYLGSPRHIFASTLVI